MKNPAEQYPEKVEFTFTLNVPQRQTPERIDAFISRSIEHASRSRVQRAIERGTVTVNGKPTKSNYKIRPGDVIHVLVRKPPPLELIPENIPLDILFEDEHLIVINKMPGMLVHPGIGNRSGTLVNAVLWHLGQWEAVPVLGNRESLADYDDTDDDGESDGDDGMEDGILETPDSSPSEFLSAQAVRPGIVHRLDRDTSGVMVVGKNYATTLHLSNQFAQRIVQREYVALAWGVMQDDAMLIETNIGRSTRDRRLYAVVQRNGKYAATQVAVVERYNCATLITCKLHTGRTHQIRVHTSWKQHPLVGDKEYGGADSVLNGIHHAFRPQARQVLLTIQRQALHARLLEFVHPATRQPMKFTTPVPEDFLSAIRTVRPTEAGPLPPCLC